MKTEKKKSKESLIGKIIYGFLLFMPLLSVLVTCLYVIQNDNAHESYYGETINESNYERSNNNLSINDKYYLIQTTYDWELTYRGYLYVEDFSIVDNGNLTSQQLEDISNLNIKRIYLNSYNSNTFRGIQLQEMSNNTVTSYLNIINNYYTISFKITNFTNDSLSYCYKLNYNKYSYLDDAFMYGLQKTEDSQYFNWAKNTALYTGVNGFTNELGITTTYIPFLMTYWLLISVVYLIYDIALMMLHMAHNKIHQLEGSI